MLNTTHGWSLQNENNMVKLRWTNLTSSFVLIGILQGVLKAHVLVLLVCVSWSHDDVIQM